MRVGGLHSRQGGGAPRPLGSLPALLRHRSLAPAANRQSTAVRRRTRHPPQSYAITEAVHTAHARQMRVVLAVFRNVVRRIIAEWALAAAEADEARLSAPAAATRACRSRRSQRTAGGGARERRACGGGVAKAATAERCRGAAASSSTARRRRRRMSGDRAHARARSALALALHSLRPQYHVPPYSLEALKGVWLARCCIIPSASTTAQAAPGAKPIVAIPPSTTSRAQSPKPEHSSEPLVLQLPVEDATGGRGASSVVSLVYEGSLVKEEVLPGFGEGRGLGVAEPALAVLAASGVGRWQDGAHQRAAALARGLVLGGGRGGGWQVRAGPTVAGWIAGARKGSVDELERDADAGQVCANGERELCTMWLLKWCLEELDGGDADADRASRLWVEAAARRGRGEFGWDRTLLSEFTAVLARSRQGRLSSKQKSGLD
ncbi:hypothetical protein C8R44DRAFT_846351 [Mycena epipterygia]|nr:hypothetical protein C8R44DRAFT_846351 [Mycena epipterygia]